MFVERLPGGRSRPPVTGGDRPLLVVKPCVGEEFLAAGWLASTVLSLKVSGPPLSTATRECVCPSVTPIGARQCKTMARFPSPGSSAAFA